MTDYAQLWNRQIPVATKASVIAGITQEGVNNYLEAHRRFDGQRYIVTREFKDGAATKFSLTLIVGGDKVAHNAGTAKPLTVAFPSAALPRPESPFQAVYDYSPDHGVYAYDQLAEPLPNVVVSARDIALYTSWPKVGGGSWSHEQKGIDFDLDAKLDLVEDSERFSLRLTPVRLRISQASQQALSEGVLKTLGQDAKSGVPADPDQKISDLFMALIELAASAVGPNLVRNIQIPVIEFGKFKAFPSAMALSDGVATVSAVVDTADHAALARAEMASLERGVQDAFLQDVAARGGLEALAYSDEILKAASELDASDRIDFLMSKPTLSEAEIEARLTHVRAFADATLLRVQTEIAREQTPALRTSAVLGKAAGEALAVAVSEDLLNRLVADIGGTYRSGFIDRLTLVLVRGRLGYELRLGKPNITITNQLTGSVHVDVFAGLYYQLKEIVRCSWRWGREHRVGLGVKGAPEVTLRTVRSNGLSVAASVNLGDLKLQTGLGSVLDKLLNVLAGLFFKAVELVLNVILKFLQFVVVPAQFAVPDQNTAIRLSRFDTSQYVRHGAPGSANNFLLVKTDVEGVKI